MANIHSGLKLTDAINHALTSAGILVGDAVAPDGRGWQGTPLQSDFVPYVVVYEVTGGTLDGPIGLPNDDAAVIYQLTSVGHDRQQCAWMADKARLTMLASPFILDTRQVMYVDVDMLGGTIRDDDAKPPVFFSPDRFRVWTTPW